MSQIITRTGRVIDVLNPRPEDIDILDIAHALSNLCRWCGHSREYYSVAQHSVLVSQYVAPEHALWGLLHDAAEAYVMDVPTPIKAILSGYASLEERIHAVVVARYGLQPIWCPPDVKAVDKRLQVTEAIELGLHPQVWGGLWVHPLPIVITPQSPVEARESFLCRWAELGGSHG